MPKHIKLVEDVIESARNKGRGKKSHYEAECGNGECRLYHYGTLIFHARYNVVKELGGWSGSDRDAISTAMTEWGLPYFVSNAKSNAKKAEFEMDGWYVICK